MSPFPRPAPGHLACAFALPLLLAACATYQPKPFDPVAHRAAQQALADQAGPRLGLDEAEQLALIGNPSLRQARAAAGVAAAQAGAAGLLDDPSIGLELGRLVTGGAKPWMVEGGLSFSLPLSRRLQVEKELARGQWSVAEREALAAEARVLRDLRGAWAAWEGAAARRDALAGHAARLGELHARIGRLVEQGLLAAYEADALAFDLAEAKAEAAAADGAAKQARLQILALCGLRPEVDVALGESLANAAPAPDGRPHPAELAAVAAYAAAEVALHLEVEKSRPELSIGPTAKREDGETTLGLGLGLTLPLWNRNRQGIAEAAARREAARADLESTIEELASGHARAAVALAAADARLDILTRESAPLLARQEDGINRLVESGELDPLRLADLLDRRLRLTLSLVEARAEAASARTGLRYFLAPLPSVPASSPAPAPVEAQP